MEVSSFLDGRNIYVCIDDLYKHFEYAVFERDVREQLIYSSDNSDSVNRNSELLPPLPSIPQASAFDKKLSQRNAMRIGAFTALLKRNVEWACKHKFEVRLGYGMRGFKYFYKKTLTDGTVLMQRTTSKHKFVAIREITDVPYVVSVAFELPPLLASQVMFNNQTEFAQNGVKELPSLWAPCGDVSKHDMQN